jgi:rare lipoprotein A (peptidoglycan hydrolase)
MDAIAALFRPATRARPRRRGYPALLFGLALLCMGALAQDGAGAPPSQPAKAVAPSARSARIGTASIYRLDGRTTASGEVYNRNALTAAHRSLPFGTIVRVTNLRNQRTVIVRINDRGSNIGNRVIDLTPRAAAAIGLHGITVGEVRLDVLGGSASRDEQELPALPARAPL